MSYVKRRNEIVDIRKREPILDACLDRLTDLIGVAPRTVPASDDPQTVKPDFLIHLRTNPDVLLLGELKRSWHPTREEVRHFILACAEIRRRGPDESKGIMLFTPWVPDSLAESLQEAGVFYVDTVGNAFLKLEKPQLVINVRGKRPEDKPKADPGRLFEATGLKVLHLLLTDPGAADLPVRVMAPKAGVSPASANLVLQELSRVGYIDRKIDSTRVVADLKPLVDYFIRGYAVKLRPSMFLGTFRHRTRDVNQLLPGLEHQLTAAGGRWALTGGVAAGLLTRHLQSDHLSLFVDEECEKAIRSEGILSAPAEGNLTLFRFYADSVIGPSQKAIPIPIATKLLVYAELLHDGRPREVETAGLLKDHLLPEGIGRGS